MVPIAQYAGGLGSQTGRVTGKSVPSLWRDERPAIKGLRPPEHHAGHSIRTKDPSDSQTPVGGPLNNSQALSSEFHERHLSATYNDFT